MREQFLRFRAKLWRLTTGEGGQDLVEYALLIAMIALATVGGASKVASAVKGVFSAVSSTL